MTEVRVLLGVLGGRFHCIGVIDVQLVSCQQRSLIAREAQEALEGTEGPLGFCDQSMPEFTLFGIHNRSVPDPEEMCRPSENTHHDATCPPPHPHPI